jgi:membrane associated rhomboid family serine protease
VASVLIAICVIAFVAELLTRNQGFESVLGRGGLRADFVANGDVWRIVTAGLLHDDRLPTGLLHIGFNMYFLYFLGQLLEPTLGRLRFATAFFISLLGGSLGALVLSPDQFTIGASGAVFGLMAVALMELRARGIAPMQTPLGTILILNLFITFGFAGFISVGGHLGGLLAGGLCGYLLFEVGAQPSRRTPVLAACIALGVGLAAASIAIA